ncbi:hypothetical protein EVAR_96884_1 [Eumeta japonica]|uniref:Uncharacterized protein n=1 Tax=Eumeta variegata TaxID=151549 RepID=A0A4C1SY09_EUMVA|nr:hypothetical protein EVAR_96884_1 [Eumeta japonica]
MINKLLILLKSNYTLRAIKSTSSHWPQTSSPHRAQASMRCVAIAGVFINVAMSDCYENASFKYNFLLKFRIHTQINFSLIFEIEDNLTKRVTKFVNSAAAAPRSSRVQEL